MLEKERALPSLKMRLSALIVEKLQNSHRIDLELTVDKTVYHKISSFVILLFEKGFRLQDETWFFTENKDSVIFDPFTNV